MARDPFDDDQSSTDFGGNVGVGFRFGLGESGNSAIRLDLEDYLYNGDFGGGDDFQNDLVASLGFSIPIGGIAGERSNPPSPRTSGRALRCAPFSLPVPSSLAAIGSSVPSSSPLEYASA